MLRFNKKFKFNQTFGKRTFNSKTQEKIDMFVSHIYPFKDKLEYHSTEFHKLTIGENTMVYLDPPYSGKVANAAGYNCYYSNSHDERLFQFIMDIHNRENSFCLSNMYSDNREMNAPVVNMLLDTGKFNLVKLDFDYDKVSRNKEKVKMQEILIKNY